MNEAGAFKYPVSVRLAALVFPVNVGPARLAFKSNADWVAVLTGLPASVVLSTLDKPTIAFVMPPTVPVKVGLAMLDFKSNAVCVAVDTGLLASLVLSRLFNPRVVLAEVFNVNAPVLARVASPLTVLAIALAFESPTNILALANDSVKATELNDIISTNEPSGTTTPSSKDNVVPLTL